MMHRHQQENDVDEEIILHQKQEQLSSLHKKTSHRSTFTSINGWRPQVPRLFCNFHSAPACCEAYAISHWRPTIQMPALHINKCHVGEKVAGGVVSNDTHGRRKGLSANATRATTSKQACDQCVQSSLPCDGCNPCSKCVQRKIRCTFVKFHRQTAPIGPGHNQSRSGNPSGSTSHHPSPPQQQPPTFNPAVGNAYGPVYEDDPFVLQPAPESSYATNYRAQQSELHRRASLPSFSASAQPWISGWHENTANGEGGPIPFNVDAGHHFAFEVGGDYRVSFSNAFGLLSLDDPAVIAGLANDGAPFFSHLNHLGVDSHLNNPTGSTGIPLDAVANIGTGMTLRNDPDATPMPIGEAQAMGLVGPGVDPNPASVVASSTSSQNLQHFPRARPSTGNGRNSNWGDTGELGTPGRDIETRELREFWKAYMRTPLSGPGGGTVGGMLGGNIPGHHDMHMLSPGGTSSGMNPGAPLGHPTTGAPSPYRRQRVSSLPSVKTPTAIFDEERYAAGFVGFNGPYGAKYPQQPDSHLLHSHRVQPSHANHQQAHNAHYGAPQPGGPTMHGNAEDLRSYEAAVLARKAPVNLSMEGLGGKMRRKAGGVIAKDNNSRMTPASASASPNLPSASHSQGSSSSPSSSSSADSSPAIPQALSHESALHVEGGESASRRPSFKRGASQVLEKGGSGKLARRTSSSRYDSLDHEYDYGGLQASASS
ncbi:c6 transcription factor [Lentinula edodes]|uniref:C6 transcription factor n=1 Tax=Lentinula edodes TaxID=5353 RepID=A0A1Q3EHZ3_LENED|nr:c6 transcription factor [Lentinula edodes]